MHKYLIGLEMRKGTVVTFSISWNIKDLFDQEYSFFCNILLAKRFALAGFCATRKKD